MVRPSCRSASARLLVTLLVGLVPALAGTPAHAQYFGRNKVQYDQFDF